jgi:hypothetical protein
VTCCNTCARTIEVNFFHGQTLARRDILPNKLSPVPTWGQSYQQNVSDQRNFQKKSENFKPTMFVREVRKII